MKRWKGVIEWSRPNAATSDFAAAETVLVQLFNIEEVSELQDIIEAGPDWRDSPIIDVRLQYMRGK